MSEAKGSPCGMPECDAGCIHGWCPDEPPLCEKCGERHYHRKRPFQPTQTPDLLSEEDDRGI